jgi:glycerophosphoryl diester phosphodiesterase
LSEGADGCELDLHLTKDKHFVAHHDYKLNPALCRTDEGHWLREPGPVINQSTLKELMKFNVGGIDPQSSLAKRYPNRASIDHTSLTTFEEIEKQFKGYNAEFWLEAKTDPYDQALSCDAISYISALSPLLQKSTMDIVLIAFDWSLLKLAKEMIPDIKTGFLSIDFAWLSGRAPSKPLWEKSDLGALKGPKRAKWFADFNPADFNHSFPEAVKAAGGTYWSPYFRDLSKELVLEAHDLGLKVSTWGADSTDEIDHALSLNVDSLTTGYINRTKKISDE